MTEARAEDRNAELDGLLDPCRFALEPWFRAKDRCFGAGQDHVSEPPGWRESFAGRGVDRLRFDTHQMSLPVPRGFEQEGMHGVVDDEDGRTAGHARSIASGIL